MAARPGVTCLLDGFPKSLDNLQLLEEQVSSLGAALEKQQRDSHSRLSSMQEIQEGMLST